MGKLADLAILTADFLTVPEYQLMNIKSSMTIVDGKVVSKLSHAHICTVHDIG